MSEEILHEVKVHGTFNFPFVIYRTKIPDFFTSFPLHWHDEIEFIVVVSGTLHMSIYNNHYELKPNDIAIVFPKVPHSFDKADNQKCEYFSILFNFSIFHQENSKIYKKYIEPFYNQIYTVDKILNSTHELNQIIYPHLKELIKIRHQSSTTKELIVLSKLYLIMDALFQYRKEVTAKEQFLTQNMEKIKEAIYSVHQGYSENITIEQIAKKCGISESHFMKLFKEMTGTSFNNYLINYRLEIAAKLIEETPETIINIAFNCGFNNQSYFTRAFVKNFGTTPNNYRKEKKKLDDAENKN